MTDCKHIHKFICENLDENLNSAACITIKKHLENCSKCRTYLNSLKTTILLYKKQDSPKLKFSISKQVLKLIKSQKQGKNSKKSNKCK